MAVIHVLDKHTAELIAAGEVVERPASVVKELLENSIDAGATQVTVNIESGGVKLIEISDNGTGIEAEYISTAFIRHATSKIETPDDLTNIHTLGFRGEALASIASVARVELTTRTEVDEFATVYRIEGGEEVSREPGARAVGTTIRVKDLFYNTKRTPPRAPLCRIQLPMWRSATRKSASSSSVRASCSMSRPATASCAVQPMRCWAGSSAGTSLS